ncbi:MAG TPA: sulfatase [Isosphaeraceae bacterium]|jgi:arylsulfatase A-like enzyme|nr:sulfatase [Isosphaeraceae bacterium]
MFTKSRIRLSHVVATALLLAATRAPVSRAGPARPRPNILVILVDDLGYGDLGSYGAEDLRTPNIDALVARGMRFRNFYANCPVCSPSRAALLTGKYPDRVGVPGVIRTDPEDNWGYLSDRAVLLPALLKPAGYHTALVGKWHLGLEPRNAPNARGFDRFHGFLGDMMSDYWTHVREGHNYMRLDDREIDPEGHATDLFTAWAVEYLRDRAPDARSGKRPFFLYLAYNAPHAPIQPPPAWLDRVKRREPGLDEKRAKLVALIEHLDDGIGQVLGALKEAGLDDDTLIVFTSDNGGEVSLGARNGPLRGTKGQMYEGGIRVPAAVVWPGRVAPGSSTDRVALHMDLMPTLCDAAVVANPAGIDGRSLLPLLEGQAADADARELYWVRREGGPFAGLASHALRRGDWKLIHNTPFRPLELYNLKDDPREQHDLAASQPRVRDDLAHALKLHVLRSGSVSWQDPDPRALTGRHSSP